MMLPALTAGLVTSLHCVGMCGPLACAICPRKESAGSRAWLSLPAYHGGRVISYTVLGGALGALGQSLSAVLPAELPVFLPWAFIVLFLLIVLGLEKEWKMPDWAWLNRLRALLPTPTGGPGPALLVGLGTPLLPCGPLYLIFGLALLAGNWLIGAGIMAAFALGTIPLLLAIQAGMIHWQGRISPLTLRRIQRSLAFVALLFMVWRVLAGDPLSFGEAKPCPMCH